MQPAPRPLPWHEAAFAALLASVRQRGASGVQILSGPPLSGVEQLADAYTAWLLCEQGEHADGACGTCSACRQWRAGSHPDALLLAPDTSRDITVEQARDCIERLSLAAHYRRHRVVRITPAEGLNRNAANALLKTLEESRKATVFLLLSAQPRLLPATVRSRAQLLRLPAPDTETATAWLRGQGGEAAVARLARYPDQPLRVLVVDDDEAVQETAFREALQQWQRQHDAVAVSRKLGDTRERCEAFLDWLSGEYRQKGLAGLVAGDGETVPEAVAVHQLTLAARSGLQGNTPPQLIVEQLLIGWQAWRGRRQRMARVG